MRGKEFNIAKNSKHDGYQRGLALMVYEFFDKNSTSLADKSASGGAVKNKIMINQRPLELAYVAKVSDHTGELAEELQKPIIRKFEK